MDLSDDLKKEILSKLGNTLPPKAVLRKTLANKLGESLFVDLVTRKIVVESPAGSSKFNFSSAAKSIIKPKPLKAPPPTPRMAPSPEPLAEKSKVEDSSVLAQRLSSFQEQLFSLEKRLLRVESELFGVSQEKWGDFSKVSAREFKDVLKEKYDRINIGERKGGVVPIPRLWDEFSSLGIPRRRFEDELFSLEKDRIIELQTASDPSILREPEKAIRHPSRGFLNYVIWRA